MHSYLQDYKISILGVSETWLLSSVPNSFVDIPSYVLLRCDVAGNVAKHGTCLYIKSSIKYIEIDVQVPNTVAVYLPDFDLYVASIYRPPSNSTVDDNALVDFLLDFCLGREVLLMGDFNLPTIQWGNDLICNGLSNIDRYFYQCFTSLGLSQWVIEPTFYPSGNILDLILTTDDDRVGDVYVLPPLPRCGHSPILCSYVFQGTSPPERDLSYRLWHKGNYTSITRHLSLIDWDFEFHCLDVNAMFSRFCDILLPLVERFVPKTQPHKHTIWQIKPPRGLKKIRETLWSEYKSVRARYGRNTPESIAALGRFQDVNHQFRNYAVNKQYEYEATMIENFTTNSKFFHSYIRHRKVGKPRIGPLKLDDGRVVNDAEVMANSFAAAFASVYTRQVPDHPEPHQTFHGNIGDLTISTEDVESVLSNLDVTSSMGPDGIHPHLLKSCRSELSYPLFCIFQKSYSTSSLPSIWKKSLVVPIFKKGSRHDPLNYRPVSLTSVCVKSLERIICKFMYDYASDNDLLTKDQFGFRAGHSTEDQLLLTYNEISHFLDNGFNVDLILFDFSKAFDVVCHTLLLEKLSKLGITGNILSWIREFLIGRVMNVVVDHQYSQTYDVHSGVPQGSVLGPLLFLLYANFLTHDITVNTKIFADDLKIYIAIKTDTSHNIMNDMAICQRDIDCLHRVSSSWGLTMNIAKCAVLRFNRRTVDWSALPISGQYKLGGRPIPTKESAVDLGILVDSSLKFHQHIANVVQKAGGMSLNLLKCTVNRDASFMMPLFITHIRPLLEYASSVWNTGYVEDMRSLESVQRRWTKQIRGMEHLSYIQRLKALDLYSMKGRLLRHDVIKYWNIFHGNCSIFPSDVFLQPHSDHSTRGHQFKIAHVRTQLEIRRRFFSVRGIALWNSLPSDVVTIQSLSVFKAKLSEQLGDRLYEYV